MSECPEIIEVETSAVPDVVEIGGYGPTEIELGIPGPPGEAGAAVEGDFLWRLNRLSEFDTPEAKAAARANLDLQAIDGGTFN